MINWKNYMTEIATLSAGGKSSYEIIDLLKERYKKVDFPKSSDRIIRDIIKKERSLISNIASNKKVGDSCKILVFDIETYPFLAYTFNKWKTNINDDFIVHDWGMLCWSAKWLFSDEVLSDKMTEEELNNLDDSRISRSIWELIDEADVVIAHNGVKFDIRKVNTKFLEYNIGRPSPYQVIDTLVHVRKRFSITSNRLDYIAQNFFGIEGKLKTETGLWRRCMDKDYSALEFMSEYCDQDVKVLEDVYLLMRSWISPHPNLALLAVSENDGCPVCLSEEREFTKTTYNTYVNRYEAYRCGNCGHIYRSRMSETPLRSNKALKVSTPN
jgi:DNA polymerase elongation subunit (family B)